MKPRFGAKKVVTIKLGSEPISNQIDIKENTFGITKENNLKVTTTHKVPNKYITSEQLINKLENPVHSNVELAMRITSLEERLAKLEKSQIN